MRIPYALFTHTATFKARAITRTNNMDTSAETGSTLTVQCRIEDNSGRTAMEQLALTGVLTGTGYFPPASGIEKDSIISVTGPGFASARKYLVKSPPQLAGGMGNVYVCGLEAYADS